MNTQQYALSVVERTPVSFSNGVAAIDIAGIIAIVLPILSMLPCIADRTPEGKRDFVDRHTPLAIAQTTQTIIRQARGRGDKIVRKEARTYATTIVNDYLSTPDSEIVEMGISL